MSLGELHVCVCTFCMYALAWLTAWGSSGMKNMLVKSAFGNAFRDCARAGTARAGQGLSHIACTLTGTLLQACVLQEL